MEPEPTLLPEDGSQLATMPAEEIARRFPASSWAWAMASGCLGRRPHANPMLMLAGYHHGLDALRGAGWKGAGPVPWSHEPNRGFLRALYALGRAAAAIGETDEVDRITKFLNDSDPTASEQIEAAK